MMLAKSQDHIPEEPDEGPLDVYWTPPSKAELDEIHPSLLEAIASRSGMTVYCACLFDCVSAAPIGYIDLAIDQDNKQVCGLYDGQGGLDEPATDTVWCQMAPTLDRCVETLIRALKAQGWL